jgi:hypothetical protein
MSMLPPSLFNLSAFLRKAPAELTVGPMWLKADYA